MCNNCDIIESFFELYPAGLYDIELNIDNIMSYFQSMDLTYNLVLSNLQKEGPPEGSTLKNTLWRLSCWFETFSDFKKKRQKDKEIINEYFKYI